MPGGGKTHNFPQGKPLPIVLLEITFAAVTVLWLFAWGSWVRAALVITIFFALGFVYSKLLGRYERAGHAVPIVRRTVVTKFLDGVPRPILALRYAFFVMVALMIVFGIVPMPEATAHAGIIACVLALFVIAVAHVALEHYYVSKGRATEIELAQSPAPAEHREQ
jgi:hypothetical protein